MSEADVIRLRHDLMLKYERGLRRARSKSICVLSSTKEQNKSKRSTPIIHIEVSLVLA